MTSKVRVLLPPPAFAREASKAAAPKPAGRRRASGREATARQTILLFPYGLRGAQPCGDRQAEALFGLALAKRKRGRTGTPRTPFSPTARPGGAGPTQDPKANTL